MQLSKLIGIREPATQLLVERLTSCVAVICGIIVLGTLGYVLIEGWSVADGFFMTVITIATVGNGETHQLSPPGRIFTAVLICISVIGMAGFTACITTAFVSRELTGTFVAKRIRKMISSMNGHTVIFGAGLMADTIMMRLIEDDQPIVLIEENHTKVDDFRRRYPEALILESNPRNEMVLFDASILNAASVVVGLDSEFDNLLVSISVKEANPSVHVISRADDPKVASRMLKIGVNDVICPFQLSGEYVANLLEANRDGIHEVEEELSSSV